MKGRNTLNDHRWWTGHCSLSFRQARQLRLGEIKYHCIMLRGPTVRTGDSDHACLILNPSFKLPLPFECPCVPGSGLRTSQD